MAWVDIVGLLAVVQLLFFGTLVGRARMTYGIKAPATVGHEIFERLYRVQTNSIETVVVFLPALLISAKYWSPRWMALIGAVYLIGRVLYWRGYVRDPRQRSLGYMVSAVPTVVLICAGVAGAVRTLLS
jgi:glutathione S-transferase